MTRTLRTSFITIASATTLASIALFSQSASAATSNTLCSAASQSDKCCARLGNNDSTGCREARIRMRQVRLAEQLKEGDGRGGDSGRGGRGGVK
ncbi:MAG: hypothetical protein H7X89_02065 [Rhizobiales bacterium]|nr:hypothetical protein [Hyphomicrobiales bacterium]